jgi:hypothetical protein
VRKKEEEAAEQSVFFLRFPVRSPLDRVEIWILKYLKGTSSFSLCFGNDKPVLDGYTYADMTGDVDSRKSTSRYLMKFAGGAVSWQSRLQKCVALSTIEAEYIALTEGGKELL